MMNTKVLLMGIAIGVAVTLAASAVTIAINDIEAEAAISRLHRVQKTVTSSECGFAGYGACQMVMVVPSREDGRTWSGTVSWTASKAVEVVLVHAYDPAGATGLESGEQMIADFGNGKVALTMIAPRSGTDVSSGSLDFAADAVVFHGHGDDPFNVTYTVDAMAKRVNRSACIYPACQ